MGSSPGCVAAPVNANAVPDTSSGGGAARIPPILYWVSSVSSQRDGGSRHCLPNAIAPTSVCLRGRVTADRPGFLGPAFTHHPHPSRGRWLVFSLLRLASTGALAPAGPPCCFGGSVYPRARGAGKVWGSSSSVR